MKLDLLTNKNSKTETDSQRVLAIVGCGGIGTTVTRNLQAQLSNELSIAYRYLDTKQPQDIPSTAFTGLRPDRLADDPGPALLSLLRAHGASVECYQMWKAYTGEAGIARLPFLSSLATLECVGELSSSIDGDLRGRAAAVGGVSETQVLTISSLIGGTGAAAARVAGLASRLIKGLAPVQRWIHVCVTSRVLPSNYRTRRALALEHRQLMELTSLMRPNATLRLPNRHMPVSQPGPDFVVLLDSSAECPRTLDEATDELAATIWNLVTV
jgi:hypothetical protein